MATSKKNSNNDNRKYVFTRYRKHYLGITLKRIKAAKDFIPGIDDRCLFQDHPIVKKGELGGWIESEENLSQEDTCWVEDDAMVFDNAKVMENAIISGNAIICDNALVGGNAIIRENANVAEDARVYDHARIFGDANIGEKSFICDCAEISGRANIEGKARISGNAKIYGWCFISGKVRICGNTIIEGWKEVDYSGKKPQFIIDGDEIIDCNSIIKNQYGFFSFKLPWLTNPTVTWALGSWTFYQPFIEEGEEFQEYVHVETDREFIERVGQAGRIQREIARQYVRIARMIQNLAEEIAERE